MTNKIFVAMVVLAACLYMLSEMPKTHPVANKAESLAVIEKLCQPVVKTAGWEVYIGNCERLRLATDPDYKEFTSAVEHEEKR